jgi:hypothetical protein
MDIARKALHGLTRREVLVGAGAGAVANGGVRSWKVGIAQISLSDNLAENHSKILSFIRRAAVEQCRVVVFPEGSLTAEPGPKQPEIDHCLNEIRAAAAAGKVYVLVGGNSIPPDQNRNRNWMVAIDPSGKQILSYKKLYDINRAPMPRVFSMDGWGCNAIICADRWLRGIEDLPIVDGRGFPSSSPTTLPMSGYRNLAGIGTCRVQSATESTWCSRTPVGKPSTDIAR